MDPRSQQILDWICTGQHVIQTDYDKPASDQSALTAPDTAAQPAEDDDASETSTSSSEVQDTLMGADNDLLIPSSADIDRVFRDGHATWTSFVKLADSLPPFAFPIEFANPAIMLKDVPALPDKLPKKGYIIGRPLWHVPDPEHEEGSGSQDWDLQYAYGARKCFLLSFPKPIECRVYSRPPLPGHGLLTAQRGLSVLTLCWSYILSVRLLELQGRKAVYSKHSLVPVPAHSFRVVAGEFHLDLSLASRRLVRWLCAILSPKPGWLGDQGHFPPWAAFCSGNVRFVVVATDGPVAFALNEPPPSSSEATELLIEFCSLYGLLAPEHKCKGQQTELSPPIAAFLAALALPFSRYDGLQPQFPAPSPRRPSKDSGTHESVASSIRQCAGDLRYYMTLSMDPRSVGSVMWSIFWQPDIDCSLVSPWLSSILSALKPALESRNIKLLAKVFALRRPRVALWWLGVFLLGDLVILDRITRYLETLEERWGFGSLAPPDIAVAAWTGSRQSFLDDESAHPYEGLGSNAQVSWSDLLRHRFNFRLQDEASRLLSWRPFGYLPKQLIEPDVWPWLDRGHAREYVHWVWWIKNGNHVARDVQLGFRGDTGRFVASIPDRLALFPARHQRTRVSSDIKLEPSKESTLRMLAYCMEDVCGDRDTSISVMPGATSHTWLRHWRGLE